MREMRGHGTEANAGYRRARLTAPTLAYMSLLRRLSNLDARVFGFRREGEPAEAYLRRFAEGRARDTRAGVQVKQALQEYFRDLDQPAPDASPVPHEDG